MIRGELTCGNIRQRTAILNRLASLPAATEVSPAEVLSLVETHRLFGKGLGYIDAHLLASARLDGISLLTRDKRLATAAD